MPAELFNPLSAYSGTKHSLSELYLSDPRPWLVGFSGGSPREIRLANHARCSTAPAISRGKDSTLVAALVFEAALAVPPAQRTKEIHVVCTHTCVEVQTVTRPRAASLAQNGWSRRADGWHNLVSFTVPEP